MGAEATAAPPATAGSPGPAAKAAPAASPARAAPASGAAAAPDTPGRDLEDKAKELQDHAATDGVDLRARRRLGRELQPRGF